MSDFKLNINKQKIDLIQNPYERSKTITSYIDQYVEQKNLNKMVNKFNILFNIPNETIKFEIKQILIRELNFEKGYFSKKFEINKIFHSSLEYILSIIWIFYFSKKTDKKKSELVIDEIESEEQAERFSSILNKFESYIFISNKNINKKYNYYKFHKYKNCDKNFIVKNFINFIIIFFQSIKTSIVLKTNIVYIISKIIKKIIKYETLFNQTESKILIQERSYTTSSIKNFLFKKHGGKITSCLQKNIVQFRSEAYYVNIDYFFSLGKKSTNLFQITGGNIKKIIPVGSLFFESRWHKIKKEDVPSYDVLVICGNYAKDHITHKTYVDDYYEHLKWVRKLSDENPELKIALKYPASKYSEKDARYGKERVKEIIKNSNVEIITNNIGSANYSYGWAFSAKFLCTWNSTMSYEMLGHDVPFFFLDPGKRNIGCLENEKFNDFWKLTSYEEFNAMIKKILFLKEKIEIRNSEDFCVKSNNFSEKICNYLKKNSNL